MSSWVETSLMDTKAKTTFPDSPNLIQGILSLLQELQSASVRGALAMLWVMVTKLSGGHVVSPEWLKPLCDILIGISFLPTPWPMTRWSACFVFVIISIITCGIGWIPVSWCFQRKFMATRSQWMNMWQGNWQEAAQRWKLNDEGRVMSALQRWGRQLCVCVSKGRRETVQWSCGNSGTLMMELSGEIIVV